MNIRNLRQELNHLAKGNAKFAAFSQRIINTQKTILGVRTPDMRKLAKATAKTTNFQEIQHFLSQVNDQIYEEILLAGLLINYAKLTDPEKLTLTKIYLQKCDNWALIDMFAEKHHRKYDRTFWWNYSLATLKSDHEFVVRFGVMNLMSNYLDEEFLEQTLIKIRTVKLDKYYVKMAIAWLYATAAASSFDRILAELNNPEINPWTRKKACQKILESYRITPHQKSIIRRLRNDIILTFERKRQTCLRFSEYVQYYVIP